MIGTSSIRLAALAAIATTSAASAQMATPPGAPENPYVSPNPVGTPGGPSPTTTTGSTMGDGNWREEQIRKMDGRRESSRKDAARPATKAELTVGAAIADNKGADVGYIKAVDADGVVVATAAGQVRVPAEALGKNKKGLLIGMSKADFDKLVAQAVGG